MVVDDHRDYDRLQTALDLLRQMYDAHRRAGLNPMPLSTLMEWLRQTRALLDAHGLAPEDVKGTPV